MANVGSLSELSDLMAFEEMLKKLRERMGDAGSLTGAFDLMVCEETLKKQRADVLGNAGSLAEVFGPMMLEETLTKQGKVIMQRGIQFESVYMGNQVSKDVVEDNIVKKLPFSNFSKLLVSEEEFLKELEENGHLNSVDDVTGYTPIMICALLGKSNLGFKLVKKGACLGINTKCSMNALMIACLHGKEDFVDMLLNNQASVKYADSVNSTTVNQGTNSQASVSYADSLCSTTVKQGTNSQAANEGFTVININEANKMGITALFCAVLAEKEEVVKKLIEHGADINDGTTILLAAEKGLKETVQHLLEAGSKVNSCSVDGFTPLMRSAQLNHIETVKLLLENNADVNAMNFSGETALHISADNGYLEICELLLENCADILIVDKQGRTPLITAAAKGDKDIVDEMLKYATAETVNARNKFGRTALFYASHQGHWQVVNLLLNARGNQHLSDNSGLTPLIVACQNGHDKVVASLVETESFVLNTSFLKAVFLAVFRCDKNILNIMLPRKSKRLSTLQDIKPDKVRQHPLLQVAASSGDLGIVKTLLNAGANINCCSGFGQTALLVAANAGHDAIVELLVQKGADVNLSGVNGETPLMCASRTGRIRIVKNLIKHQADSTSTNTLGRSALMEAAGNGFENIVKILYNQGCNVDTTEVQGWTPLMLAAQRGYTSVVRFLIERGASYKIKTRHGVTAPMISAGNGRADTTAFLLEMGADVNESDINGYTPLLHAVYNGHKPVVEILIRREANVNACDVVQEISPLSWSTLHGDCAITEILIKAGAIVDTVGTDGRSPLHNAAVGGHHQIVKVLLEAGAAVNKADRKKRTPLMLAAHKGDVYSIRHLMHKGADCNLCCSDGWTPLMFCCQFGYTECMRALLEDGNINIQCREKSGHSALSISAANDKQNAVYLLLSKGAKPDSVNHLGQTPLMLSAQNGNVEIVKRLIECKASVDQTDDIDGKTALIVAAEANKPKIVKVLLEAGANVNATTNSKMTALNISAQSGNAKIVELLVKKADIEIADIEGNTPLLSCARNGFNIIMRLLLSAGANISRKNKVGKTAMELCIEKNDFVAVTYLLQRGSLFGVTDRQQLIDLAKEYNHGKILEILKKSFSDVNTHQTPHDHGSQLIDTVIDDDDDDDDDNHAANDSFTNTGEHLDSAEADLTSSMHLSKDSSCALVESDVKKTGTLNITKDVTDRVDLKAYSCNNLIVNIYNSTSNVVNEAQNVAIGRRSSVNCLGGVPE